MAAHPTTGAQELKPLGLFVDGPGPVSCLRSQVSDKTKFLF